MELQYWPTVVLVQYVHDMRKSNEYKKPLTSWKTVKTFYIHHCWRRGFSHCRYLSEYKHVYSLIDQVNYLYSPCSLPSLKIEEPFLKVDPQVDPQVSSLIWKDWICLTHITLFISNLPGRILEYKEHNSDYKQSWIYFLYSPLLVWHLPVKAHSRPIPTWKYIPQNKLFEVMYSHLKRSDFYVLQVKRWSVFHLILLRHLVKIVGYVRILTNKKANYKL